MNTFHVAGAAVLLAGCFSLGPSSPTFSGGRAPRTDLVLEQAAKDLPCPVGDLRIVVETPRRYLNEAAFRFVVEGCGERLGYVESCVVFDAPPADYRVIDGSLACRDVLVTRLRLTAPAPAPAPDPVPGY